MPGDAGAGAVAAVCSHPAREDAVSSVTVARVAVQPLSLDDITPSRG